MKIAILGLGYVGCTAAGCIASQGHHVLGIDVSAAKVETLNAGRSPVYEPGLDDLITTARTEGRLEAVTEIGDKLDDADIAIVCVGTPSGVDGAHNMSYIVQVTRAIASAIKPDRAKALTVVYRSTMRPGTTEQMILPIFRTALGDACDSLVELVYNPEFLREATAIEDYFNPPKIVLGTIDGTPSESMVALHEGIEAPIFHVGIREAEITKFVDNTWHAVKVAFANEVGRVCQNLDISAKQVHQIFVSDTKLNISPYYTRPGGPFGGSCLPKDVRALQHIAADTGAQTHLVDSLLRSNDAHKHHQFLQATQGLQPGARVLLVGLSFKADTDDLRESPAVDMARKLLDAGYALDVYDPQLKPESLIGQNLGYAYAILPTIDGLLVDKATAEARDYAVVVATNRLIKDLSVEGKRVVDVSAIA
ncbi:MAG: GDP-mannose dehydrogenase [Novosphingobium sp. 17-62-19]|uniref:nucleotide sugar dehydrogenase n=1 Tax=Novosphingobium sp. 17-62-19 TaxID=1970406 RepID=UPI000BCBE7CE|nr:nucleotide sugar dehydrogenase [Novosphingobium sp. 17-62-19]OYX95300.1 MAG: GDP-mannose dehydrogenase [Novosphingobium sp. 35-62-5]OZA20091.1 MAG: GDP-mannose dehydrogenase [Novosphingobium sp. 17-62-19]HQS96771.1 nucleotide sugar dehydrogenase [Novosphingobium sp.]